MHSLRNFNGLVAVVSILLLPGCYVNNSKSSDGNNSYKGVSSKAEETIENAKSSDGLAVIDKKESYYEVTLNLEKGSHYDVGKAYGEAILKIYPNFIEMAEMCLYKNMDALIEKGANANILKERLEAVIPQIPKDYIDEINGVALERSFNNLVSNPHNKIRWKKFNERLKKYDKVDADDIKDILTKDNPNTEGSNIYSKYTLQTVVYDALSGTLEVAFTQKFGDDFPEKPVFVKVR